MRLTKNVLWLILPSVGVFLVHSVAGFALPNISLSTQSAIHDILKTLWMVEAALAGGILILIFFTIESFSKMNPIEVTLARFHRAIAIYPIFGGLLAILIGTGLAVAFTLPAQPNGILVMQGFQWFLILDLALFGVIVFIIGWLIRGVVRYTVPSAVAHFNDSIARDGTMLVATHEFQQMLDRTTDVPESTFEREWSHLSHAFWDIHDRAEAALHKQELPDIESAINFYRAVLETWSESRNRCGIFFNIGEKYPDWPQMHKPLTALTRPLDRVFLDLNDLIVTNTDGYPSRGYKWLLEWPINGLSLSVIHKDHLLFQRILNIYEAIYAAMSSRKLSNIADDIINIWRDSRQGPERMMMYNFRINVDPKSDDSTLQIIDYVRQLSDSNYCLTGLAFSMAHDHGAGNLIASHNTVQNILWRIDAAEYKFPNRPKERKALFDSERRLGMLLLLGLATGEWWNGRCDVGPLNYLIKTACTTAGESSEDFWSLAELREVSKFGTKLVDNNEYPAWLWRWIEHCPHELSFPGEGFIGTLYGSELLSIGILLVLSRMAQQGRQEVLTNVALLSVLPSSFDYVVGRMREDLKQWKGLICGEALCTILKTWKTSKKQKSNKRVAKDSSPSKKSPRKS